MAADAEEKFSAWLIAEWIFATFSDECHAKNASSQALETSPDLLQQLVGRWLRSPKLLLAASRAMAETLRTAAQVSAVLLDERHTRNFYRAIMAELEAESPELQARVAARLEALNSDLGLRSYVGR